MLAAALLLLAIQTGEVRAELLHADLPLFGSETQDKWPQSFSDPQTGDFGCSSRVAFGDWRLRQGDGEDERWLRITNYGVFRCFANVAEADGRQRLEAVGSRAAFFVLLGKSDARELWALQIGARPGSDYLLLARLPGDGLIKSFSVLQRDCLDAGRRRRSTPIDILRTDYCAVATKGELRRLAQRMVKLAPLGTLHWEEPAATGSD